MSVYDYEEIIASAIENEVNAFNFYTSVAEKAADAALKAIFKDLAAEELKHREYLEGLLVQPEQMKFDATQTCTVADAPETPGPALWMKPSEAIELAVKNEEQAMNKYAELARVSAESPQKAMFESLSRMEEGHKVKLESVLPGMLLAESW